MFLITEKEITIFLQLLLEMIPLSSSAQIKLLEFFFVKKGFFRRPLSKNSEEIVDMSNALSDLVVLFFFRRELWQNLFTKTTKKQGFLSIIKELLNKLKQKLGISASDKDLNKDLNIEPKKLSLTSVNQDFVLVACKFFLLAGLANSITMLFYIVGHSLAIHKFMTAQTAMVLTLSTSAIILLSNYFRDKFWPKTEHTKPQQLSIKKALLIGFFQGFTIFKGISRLGITYTVACWLSLPEKTALIFSFLLHAQISLLYCFQIGLKHHGYSFVLQNVTRDGLFLIIAGIILSYFLFRLTYSLAVRKKFYLFVPLYLISGLLLRQLF